MKQANTKHTSLRTSGVILAGAAALIGLVMACGDASLDATNGGTDKLPTGSCATPDIGCPCPTAGETTSCGKKIAGDLNFLYCYQGTRTCGPDKRWGDCLDGAVTTKALTGLRIAALSNAPLACSGGLTGSTVSVCVDGKRKGEFCSTNGDCANGERKCSGGSDSTKSCKDNSDCEVNCSEYNGHCNGGSRNNQGCDSNANCPSGTCDYAGGSNTCGAFNGICDSSGPEDGDECNSDAQCGGGTCTPPKFGACIGGKKNGKKCKFGKHCKGGGTCSNGLGGGDAAAPALDPCNPYCNVFSDSPDGVDAGSGFILTDGGLTTRGCGDGTVIPPEACDDGNTTSGDGCSAACTVEPGYYCPTPGSPCLTATCGNGIVEGLEQCDDTAAGNTDKPYDGCYKCLFEVQCPPGGACTPRCGDGVVMGAEQCDDGNTTSLDGCSSTCTVETGANCINSTSSLPPYIDVPIIYRDFAAPPQGSPIPTHPDFQGPAPRATTGYTCITGSNTNSSRTGIMKNDLLVTAESPNGRPAANVPVAGTNPNECSEDSVNEWYRDVPARNRTILGRFLRLAQQGGATSSTYLFNSATDNVTLNNINCGNGTLSCSSPSIAGFWPINALGFGLYAATGKNFHFTSEVRFPFTFKGGEQLDFTGDDDVFVYVAGKKVVDIGGIHGALSRSVTLNNPINTVPASTAFNLTVGQTYEIAVFQAERNTTQSNYRLTLNGFTRTTTVCTVPKPPEVFVRDYQAVCPAGTHAYWRLFRWKAVASAGSDAGDAGSAPQTIDFRAATADTQGALPTDKNAATTVPTGQANSGNSSATAWRYDGWPSTPVPVSTRLDAIGLKSQNWLRIYMTFNGAAVLNEWQMLYDCIDAE